MLIFEKSQNTRKAIAQYPESVNDSIKIPKQFLRKKPARLPACSELQIVRHYTGLSQENYCIDTNMYPLGSCTMKYNPRGVHRAASLPGFLNAHPLSPSSANQGSLSMLFDLQQYLCEITGMAGISLTPMAGSQGELAGVAMIKAYHQSRGDIQRNEMLIPDAAHGTNPASAAMCGFKVIELKTTSGGGLDIEELKAKVSPKTAGVMLTNPSTLGLFMRQIEDISKVIHDAGGLLYYDGANLNAILGHVRPGDMGFDVMHLNLHKTFATPHGGGGPGAGPVAVGERLKPFLPTPIVGKDDQGYRWQTKKDLPLSIGRMSSFMGNAGILLRAYLYIRLLGKKGLIDVAEKATLNANYLMVELQKLGYTAAYPTRRASHEFIITLRNEKKQFGVNAMDVAKRLLDYGFHSPTTYFPLLIPECLLIEPTETECKQELDLFLAAMKSIREEIINQPEVVTEAPSSLKLKRLDDVRAARALDLNYYTDNESS